MSWRPEKGCRSSSATEPKSFMTPTSVRTTVSSRPCRSGNFGMITASWKPGANVIKQIYNQKVPRHPSFLLKLKITILDISLSLPLFHSLSLTGDEGVYTLSVLHSVSQSCVILSIFLTLPPCLFLSLSLSLSLAPSLSLFISLSLSLFLYLYFSLSFSDQ